jgi:hypothetical protein
VRDITFRHDHVLERHHGHLHAEHVQRLGAREHVLGDDTRRPEDQVHQHAVLVPGLDEPLLVSVPVMGRDFWVFELSTDRRPTTPIH